MASDGQLRWHMPQAMQAVAQAFMATGPRSQLEHMTTGLSGPAAWIMMTCLGQTAAQAPQPVHLS